MTINADTILYKLIEDMQDNISSGNRYNNDPFILYGRYKWNTIQSLPSICICDTGIDPVDLMGDQGYMWLNILIYGYSHWDGISNKNSIRSLAMDALHFIYNDYTYTDDTELITAPEIVPGSEEHNMSLFAFDIRVKYDFTHSNIRG